MHVFLNLGLLILVHEKIKKIAGLYMYILFLLYRSGSTSWSEVANSLFEQWRHSPGHNQNMLLPSHGCAGVGIYGDGTTFYGTQIFSNQCQ